MMRTIKELKNFFLLWSTQSLSQLGSTMTNFALTLWLYEKTGSALVLFILGLTGTAVCLTFGRLLKGQKFDGSVKEQAKQR